MDSVADRRSKGQHYQQEVKDRFLAEFGRPAGFELDPVRTGVYRSAHVEIAFGYGGTGSFSTNYSVTTIQVKPRGQVKAPTVTYRLERSKDVTFGAIDAKLQKVMAKADEYTSKGVEHAEQNRRDIARAQNDLALIRRVNEQHFPEFEGTGRELTLRGTHPDRDVQVTARLVSTRDARRIAYNVACADDLTPEEAREVADLFLRLRRERAARKEAAGA